MAFGIQVLTRPNGSVSAERYAWPCPIGLSFTHVSGVTNRGQSAETGLGVRKTIADIGQPRIAARHAVDPAEPAQPESGPRQRQPHMPGAALRHATLERSQCGKSHQIPGAVIENLRRQRSRLGLRLTRTERISFLVVQAAGVLNQRIEAAAIGPWSFLTIGADET